MPRTSRSRRWSLLLLVVAALAYLLPCGLLFAMQRSVLYHPSPLLFEPDAQSIAFRGGAGALHGWVTHPGMHDAVLYFGGNGESVERDVDFFAAALPDRSVYLVPYRGYGPNPGQPSEAGIESDALAVFDAVQARHAHVALIGRSLGSGVATYVAARRPVDRLVLVTPYDSILELARARYGWLPVALLLRDRYESWRAAETIRVPVLVVVAENDTIVPRVNSDRLIARFPAKPTVVLIAHADHNNLSNSPLYASAIAGFMRDAEAARQPSSQPVPPR